MKLSNYIRDAFITSVMNDVPAVHTEEKTHEAIKKIVLKDAVEQLPVAVQKIYKDPVNRTFLHFHLYRNAANYKYAVAVPTIGDPTGYCQGSRDEFVLTPAALTAVAALTDAEKAQNDQRSTLSAKLRRLAYGCSTTKQLSEAVPEFAKYLPAEDAVGIRTLPVIAGVMDDFKAAGWKAKVAA